MSHIQTVDDRARPNRIGPSAERLASALPEDAAAVIEREPLSPLQSGKRQRGWRLRFKRRHPYGVDPLTGWTAGSDPLPQIDLRFPDLVSAVRYAERHDLVHEVRDEPQARRRTGGRPRYGAENRLCCWPTGPDALCCGNYPVAGEAPLR